MDDGKPTVLSLEKNKTTVETNGSAIGIQVQDAWMTPDLEADKKKAMTKEPQDAVWDDPQQPQEWHQH